MNPTMDAHDRAAERRARREQIREWLIAGLLLAACVFVPFIVIGEGM